MLPQYINLLWNKDLIKESVPCLISIFSKSGYLAVLLSWLKLLIVIYLSLLSDCIYPSIPMSIKVDYHNSFANIISKLLKLTIILFLFSIVDISPSIFICISFTFTSEGCKSLSSIF